MPTVLLPILPGTLPPGVCYATEQQRLNAFAANLQAQLDGMAFYNYGDTEPDVAYQGYPWLRTTDMRWYYFDGDWLSPNPYRDENERRLFVGTSAQVNLYDGGDNNVPSDRSGPMWEIDTAFNGRSPIGPGNLPTSGSAVAVATNYGADQHTLTVTELPTPIPLVGTCNNYGTPLNPTSMRVLADDQEADGTVNVSTDFSIVGGGQPHSILGPTRGCYLLKPTARLFYKI